MKSIKSDRLKKLELELKDLLEWLKLGLVPKKDLEKHEEEIHILEARIEEEKERLQFLKDGGDADEFVMPKRSAQKGAYNEMPTIPDIDGQDSDSGLSESGYETTAYTTVETTVAEPNNEQQSIQDHEERHLAAAGLVDEIEEEEEEEESYFSDKNRWKRGGIIDPDADEW